ncbi:MAG: hypothetical protein WKF65_03105 [Gaiellaceae bacterium]
MTAAGSPVVLAVHSGTGGAGYAASDRIPVQIAAMVHVDSGPATSALEPDFSPVEKPLPSREELEEEENLDGLSGAPRDLPASGGTRTGRRPPGGPVLTIDARLDVPSTVICTGYTSEQIKAAVKEGYAWLGGLVEQRDVTWVDLPTSHWPMWSRPSELGTIIGDVAKAHAPGA